MSSTLDKSTLKFLGDEYQYKLVKVFMEDKDCFKDLASIIDQNMFTTSYLRTYVGLMLDYYNKHNIVPSYNAMKISLRSKAHTDTDIEIYDGLVKKISESPADGVGQTKELATKFFMQQNMIKACNKALDIIAKGGENALEQSQEILKEASNLGTHEDYEVTCLFDGMEDVLSDDYRIVIPTGIGEIDKILNGGIGKGELGTIVGPSGYGKTTLTTSMALHASTYRSDQNNNQGFKVLQIVFEDKTKQIKRKHFSKITQVEACNLSKEEYTAYVKEILNNYPDRETAQKNLRIVRFTSGEKSIEQIRNVVNKFIETGFRPDIIFIDYFECIKLTGSASDSKWDKETKIMRKIEAMANELDVAIWVPVQGNRDSINAELVTMDNAGGALGKIQVSHIIMSITRSLEDIAENNAIVSILKNRAGASGKVIENVFFNNGTCTISTDNASQFDNSVSFKTHKQEERDDQVSSLAKSIYNETKKNQK